VPYFPHLLVLAAVLPPGMSVTERAVGVAVAVIVAVAWHFDHIRAAFPVLFPYAFRAAEMIMKDFLKKSPDGRCGTRECRWLGVVF